MAAASAKRVSRTSCFGTTPSFPAYLNMCAVCEGSLCFATSAARSKILLRNRTSSSLFCFPPTCCAMTRSATLTLMWFHCANPACVSTQRTSTALRLCVSRVVMFCTDTPWGACETASTACFNSCGCRERSASTSAAPSTAVPAPRSETAFTTRAASRAEKLDARCTVRSRRGLMTSRGGWTPRNPANFRKCAMCSASKVVATSAARVRTRLTNAASSSPIPEGRHGGLNR
mmetsp:Transcript_36985/g.87520  ORF Transcript_36985/g.87520 Transcript_36985/m.87520 type:complete len:231 (-) Transcript_36985:736-1428(-)